MNSGRTLRAPRCGRCPEEVLDESVVECYGWPKRVAQDDQGLVVRLSELNRQIVSGERDYQPFGGGGD
jgi:hypothetical protein